MSELDKLYDSLIARIDMKEAGVDLPKEERYCFVPENAVCGKCKHHTYSGIMEVTQEFGDCSLYLQSKRPRNKPHDKACKCWTQKSHGASRVELETAAKFRIAILKINAGVHYKSDRDRAIPTKLVAVSSPEQTEQKIKRQRKKQEDTQSVLQDLGLGSLFGGNS